MVPGGSPVSGVGSTKRRWWSWTILMLVVVGVAVATALAVWAFEDDGGTVLDDSTGSTPW